MQIIAACLVCVCLGAPQYSAGGSGGGARDVVPILRDDRVHEDGHYSFDIETGDGIVRSEAGQPQGEAGAVASAGQIS